MIEDYFLFKNNLQVAKKFDKDIIDFLVSNGYAVFDRDMNFGDGLVHYYRPVNSASVVQYVVNVVCDYKFMDKWFGPYDLDTAVAKVKDWSDDKHIVVMRPVSSERVGD